MGYKKLAAMLISVNTLMLVLLIAAGIQHERQMSVPDTSGTGSESTETSADGALPRLSELAVTEAADKEKCTSENAADPVQIIVSSMYKDIRISLIHEDGSQAAGYDWKAEISGENTGTFAADDSDKDGVIYICPVPSGKYDIHIDGAGDNSITVKDSVTYTAVASIKNEIKLESQIDAAKEDTAVNDETDEGTQEQSGGFDLSGGTIGIDVSKYNKDIDWNAAGADGIGYAIIRVGYRGSSTGCLVEDPYFEKNIEGARNAGLKVGVYFFTQAVNEAEAAEEAGAVAALVSASELDLPVFLDVEGSGSDNGRADSLDTATRSANIKTFCDTMTSLGYKAGVYANKKWLTQKIDTSQISEYMVWLAQYNVQSPSYEGGYSIWQYTSKGSVNGINGNVDMDLVK